MKLEKSIKWLSIVWIVLLVIGLGFLTAYLCYQKNNEINNGPIKLLRNLDEYQTTIKAISMFSNEPVGNWFDDPTLRIAGLLAILSLAWLGLMALVWATIAILNAFVYDKYTTKYKWVITFFIPIVGALLPNRKELN